MGGSIDREVEQMTSEAICDLCRAEAPRSKLLRLPITRSIYIALFLLYTYLILVPTWTLYYLRRSNRPRQSWDLKTAVIVRRKRRICGLVASCEIDWLGRDLAVDPLPETLTHSHATTIPPAPSSLLVGHPAETLAMLQDSADRNAWIPHFLYRRNPLLAGAWGQWAPIQGKHYGFAPVKGFWYMGQKSHPLEACPSPGTSRPVGLLFHGGGYLCGTAHESDLTSVIPKHLASSSPIPQILSVDYGLAHTSPWPLPLLDAISSYVYLLDIGFRPDDIVIIGESAGGHLALALTRWLRDEGDGLGLGMPRGQVLFSPWCDTGFTDAWGKGREFNADCDVVDDTFGPLATSLLLRAIPEQLMHTSPYLSPASFLIPTDTTGRASFEDFPPTCIIYGGAERLGRSIQTLWQRLQLARKAQSQVEVGDSLLMADDAVHDFVIFPWQAKQAEGAYEHLNRWLEADLFVEQRSRGRVDAVSGRDHIVDHSPEFFISPASAPRRSRDSPSPARSDSDTTSSEGGWSESGSGRSTPDTDPELFASIATLDASGVEELEESKREEPLLASPRPVLLSPPSTFLSWRSRSASHKSLTDHPLTRRISRVSLEE